MINYLIEVSICLTTFYACYWFGLSRLKLLNLNRGYLLITLILSLTIPIVDISLNQTAIDVSPQISDYTSPTSFVSQNQLQIQERIHPILVIYFIGVAVAVTVFLFRLIGIFRLIRKYPMQKTGRLLHISVPDHQPIASFFHYILVPGISNVNKEHIQAILKHEHKHAQDWHSLDLILFELATVFLWFNPIVHLYCKAIKLQHEYIADDAVLSTFNKTDYTNLLIRHGLRQSGFSLAHSFSEHPLEKRLKMIDNPNPSKMKKLIRLTTPMLLIVILFLTISCSERLTPTDKSSDNTSATTKNIEAMVKRINGRVEEMSSDSNPPKMIRGKVQSSKSGDPVNGAQVQVFPSGQSVNTNNDGTYKLQTTKADTLLVFSKAGFKTMEIARKRFSVLNVALSRETN